MVRTARPSATARAIADAPPGSWGRPIGAIKALVLAGDWPAAEDAGALGARARAPPRRSRRSAATPPRSRCSSSAATQEARRPSRTRSARATTFRTTSATRSRCIAARGRRRLHVRGRERARVVRDARRVPRGHPRRGHRARPAGARRAPRHRRRAQLPAVCPSSSPSWRVHERRDHDRRRRSDPRARSTRLDELRDQLERLLGRRRAPSPERCGTGPRPRCPSPAWTSSSIAACRSPRQARAEQLRRRRGACSPTAR